MVSPGERSPTIHFGVEYVHPMKKEYGDYNKLSKMFADIGLSSAKINLVNWQQIEPRAPKKGIHKYQWKELDRVVSIFQKEGYHDMDMVLQSTSSWAMRSRKKGKGFRDSAQKKEHSLPPREEHWKDYSDFIRNVVERYDGDGVHDMPGLKYPILYYEIETEAQGTCFWLGTTAEYIRLLQTACRAAREANSRVKIVLAGFWLSDIFDSQEKPEKRIGRIRREGFKKEKWYEYLSFIRSVLLQKDYYDVIEIHSLEDYPAIYLGVGGLRMIMKHNGFSKPIWVGDATATPTMVFGVLKPHPHPFGVSSREVVKILANKKHKMHQEVNAWYRAEQSRLVVKKSVAAMNLGLERINFGYFCDDFRLIGKPLKSKLLAKLNPIGYNWTIAGFLDGDYRPYPAFYTYKLTIEKLRYAKFIKRVPVGFNARGFHFSLEGKPLYVLWSKDEGVVNTSIDFPSPSKRVRVTSIITKFNQVKPRVDMLTLEKGKLKLGLTTNPVFVEPYSE